MPPTIGVNLRVTGNCNRGGRGHMEDMFSVAYQPTPDGLDLEYAFFGIFDGHGGSEAAQYAKEHLLKNIVSQKIFWSNNDMQVCNAIENGFLRTHYGMWKDLENWPKTITGLPSTSGTTASIVFIRQSTIYVGHTGDSGIVLGKMGEGNSWSAKRLTEDHKPETPKEASRIVKAGGQVVAKGGVPRVVWRRTPAAHQGPTTRSTQFEYVPFLAVARSLGDLWSYNEDTDQFVVSPVPDISVRRINLTNDRCIILGTDGLLNVLSPNEAVTIVEKVERHNKSLKENPGNHWINPSKVLVDQAIGKWKASRIRADNTSAVVLLLDPLGPPDDMSSTQMGATHSYTIESYKTRDDESAKNETSGMAIRTLTKTEPSEKIAYKTKQCTTLKGMAELFEPGSAVSVPAARSPRVDSVPNKTVPETKKEKPETTPTRRNPRRGEKCATSPKRSSGNSPPATKRLRLSAPELSVATTSGTKSATRTSISAVVAAIPLPIPTENDSENSGATMKLRSAVSFKTLRSRNVNLDSQDRHGRKKNTRKCRQRDNLPRASVSH